MQTPKEKSYNLYKKFYNVDGQDFHNTMSSKIAKNDRFKIRRLFRGYERYTMC